MGNKRRSSGVPSAYAGGYSEAIKRQLESVVLPDKIKCKTCNKFRMQSAYSKRQLEILINAVVVQGNKAYNVGHAACRSCTGHQTTELKCCICDQVKGLEQFARNQRHEHEFARCLNCVQNLADTEPVLEEHKLLAENELSTAQGTTVTASQVDDASLVESSRRLTIGDAPRYPHGGSGYEDDDEEDGPSCGGGVWLEPERNDENSTKGKGVDLSGNNSRGKPHGTASVIAPSVHSGWASWAVNVEANKVAASSVLSPTPLTTKRESKFAKILGGRFEKHEAPNMRVPEPTGPGIPSDDEDDEARVEDFL